MSNKKVAKDTSNILVTYNPVYKKYISAAEVAGYLKHILNHLRVSLDGTTIKDPLFKTRIHIPDTLTKQKKGPFSLFIPPEKKEWDLFELLNNYRHIHVAHQILSAQQLGNREKQVITLNLCQGNGIDIVLKSGKRYQIYEVYGGENRSALGVKERKLRNEVNKQKYRKERYFRKNSDFFVAYFECLDTKDGVNNGMVAFKKV